MRIVTVDVFNDEGIKILEELELKKVLRIHRKQEDSTQSNFEKISRYKGKMTKQPIEEVEKQLKELRDSWE